MKKSTLQSYLYAAICLLAFVLLPSAIDAQRMEGMASFYGDEFNNKLTSTGETFRQTSFMAASKELPWGTVVEVTNLSNGKTTQVWINDCGPHARGRLIDLSKAAAIDLDFIKQGETKVRLRILQASNAGPTCGRGAWSRALKKQGKAVPPPPAPWDPTKTVAIKPVNPVVPGPVLTNPASPVPAGINRGMAGYYPDRLNGRSTSTGEIYDRAKFTAASKTFAYGTRLEVTNIVNGAKVEVLVNDCGPNSADRIIDLSRAAADRIGLVRAGSAAVELRVIEAGTKGPTCNRSAWVQAQRANTVPLGPGQVAPPGPTVPGATAPAPAPSTSGNLIDAYQLQVGAFGDRTNAEAVVSKLVKAGLPDTYAITSGKLTRVFTGLSATKKEAEAAKKAVAKVGYPKTKVVKTQVAPTALAKEEPATGPATYGTSSTPTPAPAPAPTREYDPTDILFGVQVSSFSSKANADKAMTALREAGIGEVYSAKVGKAYRVFVGKFYFQSQAETEKEKLAKLGFGGGSVRRVQ